MPIAVIGTGLAGLGCAHALRARGKHVRLFEKSRGVGGRLSTRRRDGVTVDHGAPMINAVEPDPFRMTSALAAYRDGVTGVPRMNSLPKTLGRGFDVTLETAIQRIDDADPITITDALGAEHGPFSKLIVAIPAPQAFALLADIDGRFAPVDAVEYDPCWTFMSASIGGGRAERILPADGPFEILIRDDAKPDRPQSGGVWVGHTRAEWARDNLELTFDEAEAALRPDFEQLSGLRTSKSIYTAVHRWRYAHVARAHPEQFILSKDGRIGACGDWCGEDRSNGDARAAWDSGAALGREIPL